MDLSDIVNMNPEKISLEDFFYIVKEMRFNQRRYSVTKKPEILEKCRKIEKKVDEFIYSRTNPQLKFF